MEGGKLAFEIVLRDPAQEPPHFAVMEYMTDEGWAMFWLPARSAKVLGAWLVSQAIRQMRSE